MTADQPNSRFAESGRNAELIAAAREQFLQTPSARRSASADAELEAIRAEFGNYELVRELHRGGQGVVYLAWQRGTRRRVAIKMVREGPFASPGERARFQREIEILGGLDHPNIVTIHDSGVVRGNSYYVMDFVEGVPLDEHARQLRARRGDSRTRSESRRFIRAALSTYVKICDAVQAAHLRGVIHRDLKPGNVWIDAHGEPRVLDFGLAKAMVPPDGSSTAGHLTHTGQFLGTLAYASPEQAEGESQTLDIRTDVYSLGVMLYESLTGALPYVVTGRFPDVLDNIRRAEPARPSSATGLRDDLDTIVLKCLSKDRHRRYQAAGELAADLRRYLAGEPIAARREGGLYHLRVFFRRHRPAALAAMAFVVLLGASSVTLGVMYSRQVRLRAMSEENERRARASEALALQREREAARVTEFQASLFSDIDTQMMGVRLRRDLKEYAKEAAEAAFEDDDGVGRRLAALEAGLAGVNFTDVALRTLEESIFDRTVETIDSQFDDQPLVRARLHQTVADTLCALGLFDRAVAPQSEALEIRARLLGDEDDDTVSSISAMGRLLQSMGRMDEAMAHHAKALELRRRILGDEHPDTLRTVNDMGSLLIELGRLDEALAHFDEVLIAGPRVLGEEHPDVLSWMNNMGFLLQAMGRYDEARVHYEGVLEARRRVLGDDHPATLNSLGNLGRLGRQMGRLDEAMAHYQEALAGNRRVLGNEHLRTLQSLNGTGALLQSMGRYDEAQAHFREALETGRRILGDEHSETLTSINNLGHLFHSMGRFDEALPYYQEALGAFRRRLGEEHPSTITLMGNMASLLASMGRNEQAIDYRQSALVVARRALGDQHPTTLISVLNLGHLFLRTNRLDEAEVHLREAQAGFRQALGDDHPLTLNATGSIGGVLQESGRLDEAMAYRREALDAFRRVRGDKHPDTLHTINKMGALLLAMERFDEAERHFIEAAAGAESLHAERALRKAVSKNLIGLYEAWHAAEPREGHDRSAARWRAALEQAETEDSPGPQP